MRIHDGAYGTLLQRHLHGDESVDDLCLRAPHLVVEAHRAYADAGAQVLQTNAFLVHLRGSERRRRELRRAALACAREVTTSTYATVGPDGTEPRAYWEPIEQALEAEVPGLVCETVTDARIARAIEAAWREVAVGVRDVEVLLGCSISPAAGMAACRWVVDLASDLDDAITLGLNCCEGPTGLRPVLEEVADRRGTVWAMPSAGLPLEGAGAGADADDGTALAWPLADPAAWAEAVREAIDDLPVLALGGCCGTTPDSIHQLVAS